MTRIGILDNSGENRMRPDAIRKTNFSATPKLPISRIINLLERNFETRIADIDIVNQNTIDLLP